MLISWVEGNYNTEPYFMDENYRDKDERDTVRPVGDGFKVESGEYVGEVLGRKAQETLGLDLYEVDQHDTLYRGVHGTECDTLDVDPERPAWFGSLETAWTYVRKKGRDATKGVTAFKPVEKLLLFDLFSAKNAAMLLEHHAGDAVLCELIRRYTGFTGKQEDCFQPDSTGYTLIKEILAPEVRVGVVDNKSGERVKAILNPDGTPAHIVVIKKSPESCGELHYKHGKQYEKVPVLDFVDLGTHRAGRCDACFTRYSFSTAEDTKLLMAIRDMCASRFPGVPVAGYHASKTFKYGIFHAEIALFRMGSVKKDCDIDTAPAVGGSSARSCYLADAVLFAVLLAAAVMG